MPDASTATVRRSTYAVIYRLPASGLIFTATFDTDHDAVRFMERAPRLGLTIIECRTPGAEDDVMDLAVEIAAPC